MFSRFTICPLLPRMGRGKFVTILSKSKGEASWIEGLKDKQPMFRLASPLRYPQI